MRHRMVNHLGRADPPDRLTSKAQRMRPLVERGFPIPAMRVATVTGRTTTLVVIAPLLLS